MDNYQKQQRLELLKNIYRKLQGPSFEERFILDLTNTSLIEDYNDRPEKLIKLVLDY